MWFLSPFRRGIGFKKITQRRRSRGRIIQMKQTHYEPKPPGQIPIPMSVMGTGVVRRLVASPKSEAAEVLKEINWDAYKTGVTGVRWHASGAFRVHFNKTNWQHNFMVDCTLYFRVSLYGFEEAKRRAIAYRRRLEEEWSEMQKIWRVIEKKTEIRRYQKKKLFLERNGGESLPGPMAQPVNDAASTTSSSGLLPSSDDQPESVEQVGWDGFRHDKTAYPSWDEDRLKLVEWYGGTQRAMTDKEVIERERNRRKALGEDTSVQDKALRRLNRQSSARTRLKAAEAKEAEKQVRLGSLSGSLSSKKPHKVSEADRKFLNLLEHPDFQQKRTGSSGK